MRMLIHVVLTSQSIDFRPVLTPNDSTFQKLLQRPCLGFLFPLVIPSISPKVIIFLDFTRLKQIGFCLNVISIERVALWSPFQSKRFWEISPAPNKSMFLLIGFHIYRMPLRQPFTLRKNRVAIIVLSVYLYQSN